MVAVAVTTMSRCVLHEVQRIIQKSIFERYTCMIFFRLLLFLVFELNKIATRNRFGLFFLHSVALFPSVAHRSIALFLFLLGFFSSPIFNSSYDNFFAVSSIFILIFSLFRLTFWPFQLVSQRVFAADSVKLCLTKFN